MRRWLAALLLCVLTLALQGCFTAASAILYSEMSPSPELDLEPSHVVAVSAYRLTDGLELSVLYDDGVLRHAEWDRRTQPLWTEDRDGGLNSDLDAERIFERLPKLEARGRWTEVVGELDRLLTESGDRVVQTRAGPRLVRDEARRRLLALESSGRAAYDLAHEGRATALLARARRHSGQVELERILALHPASGVAPAARRLLIDRMIEAGGLAAARPHLNLLLKDPALNPAERERLLRIRARLPWRASDDDDSEELTWRPLSADLGWPEPPQMRQHIAASGKSGLVLESDQLRLYSAGGEPLALVDLRRQKPRESPLPWRTQLARGARFAVHATLFAVGLAVDLCTWPLQLTGVLLYLGLSD